MAALPNPALVSLADYLNSSYSPDQEYVDGVLVERNVGSLPHGLLQKMLLLHLARFEQAMKFLAIPECRTKVQASRYRIPDVLLAPEPVNRTARFYSGVPLAVIEILSPDDRMKVTLERFRDYETLGVQHIIQMDPEDAVTHRFEEGNLIRGELVEFAFAAGAIPFDTVELYRSL